MTIRNWLICIGLKFVYIIAMKVLLVDDSDQIRRRIADTLTNTVPALTLHEADSASRAAAMLAAQFYDALVLDLRLPDGSGLEILREVRPRQPGLTIIVLTNDADDYYRSRCQQLGADFFFDKSAEFFFVANVLQALAEKLAAKETQTALD